MRPLFWGTVGFTTAISIYSVVVAYTTPNLPLPTSIQAAVMLNPHILLGVPTAAGIQSYLAAYLRAMPCRAKIGAPALVTGSTSALSAVFSFFGLTQVGCCTLWLYYLSMLPSLVGAGAAGFMIQYSSLLAGMALLLAFIPIALLARQIREIKRSIRSS